jgi:acetyl-CoA carboxylase biotin carboxylase subunit
MFRKILIANRGEIAVRVARACRDLGISPIAVFSEADQTALHVRMCDEAYEVGAAASVESYLRIDRIIDAAKKSGAEAIHPGYGFLAENADFARAVRDAGLTFIGPSAEAMELMGSKTSARRVAIEAGAPVVPGTTEPLTSHSEALEIAERFGYPVMLKASAGGGGKGMRLVKSANEMPSAFETARAEAAAAFGNDEIYLEKAIERPRHIEIQIFADAHGNVLHLGERECSIQRRHQKVIEECPSPIDDADLRERMGEAAVKIASRVNYTGAGTIEFLVADATRDFYFLEMNTRLQVEHPVTELVTGFDLVREQITVADGAALSFTQADVVWRGHAIECRVYAEDPDNNFLPAPGKINYLRVPAGAGIRDDGGVEQGAEVSIYYDPMISKLAAWGRTRAEAIDRLRRALDEYSVGGIKTTLPFFREIVRDTEFIKGRLDTGFIERFFERRNARRDEHADADNSSAAGADEPQCRDMAIIAAALDYTFAREGNSIATPPDASTSLPQKPEESRWRMAGRAALHNS